MDYFWSVGKQLAEAVVSGLQSLMQEQLAWQYAFGAGQQVIPQGGSYTPLDLKEDYLCAKLSKHVYTATEWIQTETTGEVPPGMYWGDLDAELPPVDAEEWKSRREAAGLGRADKDICQYAVKDVETVVISEENPRCVMYIPANDSRVVYVAFRGTLTGDDIKVIMAHNLANFHISGRQPLLVHEGMGYILNTVWRQLDDALAEHADRRVVFTGHSLGGALAILACTRSILSQKPRTKPRFTAVTFGAPLVIAHGPDETRLNSVLFNRLKPHIRNYIYACDVVPRLLGKGLSRSVVALVHSDYLSSWSNAASQHGQQVAQSLSQYSPVGTFYYMTGVLETPENLSMYRYDTYDTACGVANLLDITQLQTWPTRGLNDHKVCLYVVALSQATRRALNLRLPRYIPPPLRPMPDPEAKAMLVRDGDSL